MSVPAWNEVAIDRSHNRKTFDCGREDLNIFLAQHARQAHEAGHSKTYVAVDRADRCSIRGFYTLSPAQVEMYRVPLAARPRGSRYPVAGFRLGRLAIDRRYQGQGLGGQLLVAAAIRCVRASAEMGGTAMIIDAKDEVAATWYRLYGAMPLTDAPLSLVLPYETLRATLRAADKSL